MRVERVVLEHHRDAALARRQVVDDRVADDDLAAADRLEPGDHAQRRRLGAARGSDEHHELAVRDVEVDAVHGLEAVGVDLLEVSDLKCVPCDYPFTPPAEMPSMKYFCGDEEHDERRA